MTDLQTGRAVLVRINDRGPAEPGRLIAVTRRTAELLGEPGNAPFPVRLELQEAESRQLAAALAPPAPLQVEAAPRDAAWQVRIGPLRDTAEADAVLDRALRAGVSDARIIVDVRAD
jgi:rare lipoprotein A